MFRVSYLVEDKRLGETLQALSGKVLELTQQPVTNVKTVNGHAKAESPAGSVRDALLSELMRDPQVKKTRRFTIDMARAVIEKLGGSPNSVQTHLGVLKERKKVKSVGRGRLFIVGAK